MRGCPSELAVILSCALFCAGPAYSDPIDGVAASSSYISAIEVCIEFTKTGASGDSFEEALDFIGFSSNTNPNSELIAESFVAAPSPSGLTLFSYEEARAKILMPALLQRQQADAVAKINEQLKRQSAQDVFSVFPIFQPVYQNAEQAIILAAGAGFLGHQCMMAIPLDLGVIEHFGLDVDESALQTGYKSISTRSFFSSGARIEFLWFAPSLAEPAKIMPLQVHVRQDL